MKKVRRSICLFLASCMIMSVLCFTASAESGTYNNRTYTISLSLGRRAMTSQLSYPTPSNLDFWATVSPAWETVMRRFPVQKMVRGQKSQRLSIRLMMHSNFIMHIRNTIASRIICRPLSAGSLNFK